MQLPYAEISEAQRSDKELDHLRKSSNSGLQLRDVELNISGQDLRICCVTICDCIRPYIPPTFRKAVIDCVHGISHSEPKATAKLIAKRFV